MSKTATSEDKPAEEIPSPFGDTKPEAAPVAKKILRVGAVQSAGELIGEQYPSIKCADLPEGQLMLLHAVNERHSSDYGDYLSLTMEYATLLEGGKEIECSGELQALIVGSSVLIGQFRRLEEQRERGKLKFPLSFKLKLTGSKGGREYWEITT